MDRPCRIVFCGTPDFAVPALERLVAAGHEIACVLTQPPRPSGRGHRPRKSPVHRLAERHGIPVRTPARLKGNADIAADLAELAPDLGVVAAYGLILPEHILATARHGFLNIHASLLPRWRGAAPIQHALLAGDTETGVTIMKMDAGLDTGPILAQEAVAIGPEDDAGTLHDRLSERGAALLVRVIPDYVEGRLKPRPQPQEGASYAPKITPQDLVIDWTRTAEEILRKLRAFAPQPGARTAISGTPVKILGARPADAAPAEAPPGTIIATQPLLVSTGRGVIEITRLQRAGKRPLAASEFLRGFPLTTGAAFESLAA